MPKHNTLSLLLNDCLYWSRNDIDGKSGRKLSLFPRVILQDEGYNPIFGVGQTEQVRLSEAGHN